MKNKNPLIKEPIYPADSIIVRKVWGEEEIICNTPLYAAKYLYVDAGFVCSEHRHLIKDETFFVLMGKGLISLSGKKQLVNPSDTIHVPPTVYHLFASVTGMTLLEISTHHSDDDVERLTTSHELGTHPNDSCLLAMMEEQLKEDG